MAQGVEASPKLLDAHHAEATLAADVALPNDGESRVLAVDLIGRRGRCKIGWARDIIADRIITARIVAVSS
jgi:hypothetical protein